MSRFLTGDDDWQGKECSHIEGELMRRGGRLPERLTARDLSGRMKLTFAIHRDSLAITHGYVLQLPNCIKVSREASLRGQPRMH